MNPTMLQMMKRTVDDGYGMSFKDGCENEMQVAYKYYKAMGKDLQSVVCFRVQQSIADG